MIFVKISLLFICLGFYTNTISAEKPEGGDCTCVSLFFCDCRKVEFDVSDFQSKTESSDTGLFMTAIIVSSTLKNACFLLLQSSHQIPTYIM